MPVKKMSALWVSKLKHPEKGREEYSDTGQRGLVLRVGAETKTWFCKYRVLGDRKIRRIKIGRYPSISYSTAKKVARSIIVKADNGKDPAAEKQSKRHEELTAPTFKTIAEIYIEYHAKRHKRPRSIAEDQRILEKDLLPAWEKMKAADIKRRHVINLLDDIAERGPVMANRTLALASTIFNVACDRELVDNNPCYRIKKPGGKEDSRDRVLSEEEVRAVWMAFYNLRPKMKYLMQMRMLTGQRGGEVCSMSWADIDFDEKVWTIPVHFTKNGKAHRVPLSRQVVAVLEEIKNFLARDNERLVKRGKEPINSDWVFPSNHGSTTGHIRNVQKAAQQVQRESGVPDFRLHDMRRTVASMMAEMGVPEFNIGRVLNHSSESITGVYNRYQYDEEKRRALQKWADRLEMLVTCGEGQKAKIVNLR